MRVHKRNRAVLEFEDSHPAKRFLLSHHRFREECIGLEIDWPNSDREVVEQEWQSHIRGKRLRLSDALYQYFSFTPNFQMWLDNWPTVTPLELHQAQKIQECRQLLHECLAAARQDENEAAIEIVRRANEVLDLWEESINARIRLLGQ